MNRVLVFLGEESLFEDLSLMLRQEGMQATVARSAHHLAAAALADPYDAVLAPLSHFQDIPQLRDCQAQRIAVAERNETEAIAEALGRDVDDYIFEPIRREELHIALQRPRGPRRQVTTPDRIIGTEGGLAKPWRTAMRAAGFDADVLLTGASGTGKELFAQAIHSRSKRSGNALVALNCAAIPQGLAESLLFGHVEGAFTGAHATTRGVFAQAHGGTLFLDEVGDLSEDIQVKLLRALQTGEVHPLGADVPVQVDVRVVAATSRDLPALMAAGSFREDLYYRLAVIPIALPLLRDREADIAELVEYFVSRFAAQHLGDSISLSKESNELLASAPWPGNVRQLQNAIERLVVLCEGPVIEAELVRREIGGISSGETHRASLLHATSHLEATGSLPLKAALKKVEADLIREALAACDGKRGACAARLSISRRALLYKLKDYGIQ